MKVPNVLKLFLICIMSIHHVMQSRMSSILLGAVNENSLFKLQMICWHTIPKSTIGRKVLKVDTYRGETIL